MIDISSFIVFMGCTMINVLCSHNQNQFGILYVTFIHKCGLFNNTLFPITCFDKISKIKNKNIIFMFEN